MFVKNKRFKSGFAHIIAVIILGIALVGGLSFVVWRNYSNMKSDSIISNKDTKNTVVTPVKTINTELTEVLADEKTFSNLAIKYPDDWVKIAQKEVSEDGITTTLTSPDGKIKIIFVTDLISGWGGICQYPTGQKAVELVWLDSDVIANYPSMRFVSYIYHDTVTDKYGYFVGAQNNNDWTLPIKVGYKTESCDPFGIDSGASIVLEKEGVQQAAYVVLSVELININEDSTKAEINAEIGSKYFVVAKQIVQSLYVKE